MLQFAGALLVMGLLLVAPGLMFGASWAKKLAGGVIIAAVMVSFVLAACNMLLGTLADVAPGNWNGGWGVVGLILLLLAVAFIRFINRRRVLKKWLGEGQTSIKKRVERE